MRPSDGSSLKISFDWNDDHSSWRLEELADTITEARATLQAAGHTTEQPTYLDELGTLVASLRGLHRSDLVSDATVRRALALADELDLGDIWNDDATFEYESVIDHVTELLEAWDDHNTWAYLDEEWDVSAARLFDRCRESRNGLGERWSITFDDDRVELPDGTVVHGLRPEPHQVRLFDEITVDLAYVDEQDQPGIAKAIMGLNDATSELVAAAVCELAAGRQMDIDLDTANTVIRIVQQHDTEELAKVIDTVSRLAEEWSGSESDLLCAAEALLSN